MAISAQVVSRRDGRVLMSDLLGALGVTSPQQVPDDLPLTEPGWTLFAFDFARREAVFVQTALCDLSSVPFCYQAQYHAAQATLRIPFAAFEALAASIPRKTPLVHLFNIGHCGSTLLHAALNGSGRCFCLSEPLFTFQLAMARQDLGAARVSDLMRAGLGFLRVLPGTDRGPLIVKHFSQATVVIPAFQAAEPDAQPVFLHRKAEDWCASVYGFSQKMGVAPPLTSEQRRLLWWVLTAGRPESDAAALLDLGASGSSLEEIAAVGWCLHHQDLATAKAAGSDLLAISYEDLSCRPDAILTLLFDHMKVPNPDISAAMRAFGADSHAGTATARDVPTTPLGAQGRARVRAMLDRCGLGQRTTQAWD